MKNTVTPCTTIIFGPFGHLAKKSIYPSLVMLFVLGRLPDHFQILGYGRSAKTTEDLREYIRESVSASSTRVEEEMLTKFLEHCSYVQGEYSSEEGFHILNQHIQQDSHCNQKYVFYFAIPPSVYKDCITHLAGALTNKKHASLLFEKPFGTSEEHAKELYYYILRYFDEDQIFLIDHYLAKAAVMNILFLRQSNRLLLHALSGSELASISIESFEKEGLAERAGYYDDVGITKDMVQSHLLSILALATMNIPLEKSYQSIQREKIALLNSLRLVGTPKFGQYASYQQETGVAPQSSTETYVEMNAVLDLEAWNHVPITIRAGKKMKEDCTRIVFTLQSLPFEESKNIHNTVTLTIKPSPEIALDIVVKSITEQELVPHPLTATTSIPCHKDDCLPEHVKIFEHVLRGERMYFLHIQEVFAAWKYIDAVLAHKKQPTIYPDHISPSDIQL